MRVALDLDGVIYPFCDVFRLFADDWLGRRLPEPQQWDLAREWDLDDHRVQRMMRLAHDRGILFHLGTPAHAAEHVVADLLDGGHEVVFVTARPEYAVEATRRWLDTWGFTSEVIFARDKTLVAFDVLVDDSPEQIALAASHSRDVIIFDQPWNREVEAARAYIMSDLPYMIAGLERARSTK